MERIIRASLQYKALVLLLVGALVGLGIWSAMNLAVGAVPDITNNQVQVITTTRILSAEDVEKFITAPIELEMGNIQGVQEIRSVSKYGLSVVTIVFDDAIGTYLPRQLIAEKLATVSQTIPAEFGQPFMGPISTGLGEIYQYVLEVKPGFKDQYSPMELRTIHDWVVRRQLAGIPGVVEVNTWGGYLKQYEISIDPVALNNLNISVHDVFSAVESNNSVEGGAYIEHLQKTYFIRGEGRVASLDDLYNIVVTSKEGKPILLRDVANVRYGHAPRFGAITANGEGEKVLGQVMMLKGANSLAVIQAVKERVRAISSALPDGVYIRPILDRSDLIAKTTKTIETNLVEGCLIVIGIVVLLLGSLRSGLIIGSLIPLSLLFALTLMKLTGVDANLMSLGAIDFGIIIDGAVIIVEFLAWRVSSSLASADGLSRVEKQVLKTEIIVKGSAKMMKSAFFGQLIILIVFIPILSMQGVEGKMFIPMALTFSFALIGAMLLSMTYVPVVSWYFLKAEKRKSSISTFLFDRLEALYEPVVAGALKRSSLTILGGAAALTIGIVLFLRLGGEFVPTLDEGDFVIQPVLPTGTGLEETVRVTTLIEEVLVKKFPEVEQVVSRIGAAEVPTDPMSMEESDVIIRLAPPDQWRTASTKDALADSMKAAITSVLNIDMEFTQPIEMRFNELITGVRADVAIKIFGSDLDMLFQKASEIKTLISDVPGASDIVVEKIEGTPMIQVNYKRDQLARYGLSVNDINPHIAVGVAGLNAGTVFEADRKFDLVIRLNDKFNDAASIEELLLDLPNGGKVPLRELAEVEVILTPAKIARDAAQRRIVVGVNVRNRDLESVVTDIQQIVNTKLELPSGYSIQYGGQFENLQRASRRLAIAVPIALVLIFVLLYVAFRSIKEALLIFSAIPLAAVGGVVFLTLRDMPFSISAGVGFIALFGIAVLNGIVLIEHFKEMIEHGEKPNAAMLIKGAKSRLRPVLLTASAAALGFLPMALSHGAGAEVQRPLATVVIGGLITSTLLTLVLIPVLYHRVVMPKVAKMGGAGLILFLLVPGLVQGQITLQSAELAALNHYPTIQAATKEYEQAQALIKTTARISLPQVYHSFDQNNIAENGEPIAVWGFSQSFPMPGTYKPVQKQMVVASEMAQITIEQEKRLVIAAVQAAFMDAAYADFLLNKFQVFEDLYERLLSAAELNVTTGNASPLFVLRMKEKWRSFQAELETVKVEKRNAEERLFLLTGLPDDGIPKLPFQLQRSNIATAPPSLLLATKTTEQTKMEAQVAGRQWFPSFQLEGFTGTNQAPDARVYNGFKVGLQLPLWPGTINHLQQAAKLQVEAQEQRLAAIEQELLSGKKQDENYLKTLTSTIEGMERDALPLAEEMQATLRAEYELGISDFFQFLFALEESKTIYIDYVNALRAHNNAVIHFNKTY